MVREMQAEFNVALANMMQIPALPNPSGILQYFSDVLSDISGDRPFWKKSLNIRTVIGDISKSIPQFQNTLQVFVLEMDQVIATTKKNMSLVGGLDEKCKKLMDCLHVEYNDSSLDEPLTAIIANASHAKSTLDANLLSYEAIRLEILAIQHTKFPALLITLAQISQLPESVGKSMLTDSLHKFLNH